LKRIAPSAGRYRWIKNCTAGKGFSDWTYIDAEDYEKIRKESQMPTRENSIACRLTQTDGTVRLIYVYSDEKYQYIEEAGSIWRNKQHKGIARDMYPCIIPIRKSPFYKLRTVCSR
jgi:hypothetical protein